MASLLSEFHFHLSQVPAKFDFEHEQFDIKNIYDFYHLKHLKTPVTQVFDKWFSSALQEHSLSKQDYEVLYVKSKTVSSLAQQVFEKNQ
ncbi:UNKNOWN [Stylonychia lemnae]|uniref:Uncharacterized protein n=1 Tax=Stylonychia lemnae TaxID=5949 RepID=A0A078A3H1_STYLE|nr:UNKNOWN [Stylonychia lemnae]|eukprot:CDW76828.1 UNKNOWN [Stylonychia lemnae]